MAARSAAPAAGDLRQFRHGRHDGQLHGLAAARGELLHRQGYDVEADGLFGAPPLRVIVSEESHITVFKALSMLGLGRARVERVPVDNQGRMISSKFPELDGRCIVVTQAGNVNSGAFDPIGEICERAPPRRMGPCRRRLRPLGRSVAEAPPPHRRHVALADSWATDGHKWLNTPYDSGFAFCRHPEAVRRAMATHAAYLPPGEGIPSKDRSPEFSKRARGVEAWAALRSLGRDGVADLLNRCCEHARRFAAGLEAQGFTILNDVVLNQVVATLGEGEAAARNAAAIVGYVQTSGECWFGLTKWQGRDAFRISVSSWKTSDEDVDRTLRAIAAARASVGA
jgi:glutamate/tyrosine decarboxylase-like PLP-dependent enzyme